MNIIALICARSGSKGVPNKNIKLLSCLFCSITFLKNLKKLFNSLIKRADKGSGIRTHNDGFEDHNFTIKLFLLRFKK